MSAKTFKPYGIIPAVITPITAEGKFNEKAMRKLVNYLIGSGAEARRVEPTVVNQPAVVEKPAEAPKSAEPSEAKSVGP